MSTLVEQSVITDAQRLAYEREGYLLLPGFVSGEWLARLRAAADGFVERSRSMTRSDKVLDLEVGHSADQPRLRRLISPVDHDESFRTFALEGPAAQLAAALLGGTARYHHSKLNYKASDGGAQIDWHQDIQFWPHTDFTPLTIGVYLDDVDDDMGPMGIVPRSHDGELFDLFDDDGRWSGSIRPADLERVPLHTAHFLTGPAGSVTVHNCCAVHGSVPNDSDRPRPLLLQTYSAADSFPLLGVGTNGRTGGYAGVLVGAGAPPASIEVAGRRMRTAPDWSRGGYTTIFQAQEQTMT